MKLKQTIAACLCAAMLAGMLPTQAFAAAEQQGAGDPLQIMTPNGEPAGESAWMDADGTNEDMQPDAAEPNEGEQTPAVQAVDLTGLVNIAAQAEITQVDTAPSEWGDIPEPEKLVDGDYATLDKLYCAGISGLGGEPAWAELTFGEARSIGGVEVAFQRKDSPIATEGSFTYTYDVIGKDAEGNEILLAENATADRTADGHIRVHAFDQMKMLTAVRVNIKSIVSTAGADPWPILAEVKVFAENGGVMPDPPVVEPGDDNLVEVAAESEITAAGGNTALLVDGKLDTLWNRGAPDWPAWVDFKLPGNMLIQRVEIDFEKVANRSMNVMLSRAVNNVTSDYQNLMESAANAKLTDTFVYTLDQAQRMTNLKIALSDPIPSTIWPAMAEVRIYAVNEDVALETYDNIASRAEITSVGGEYGDKTKLVDGSYDTLYGYYDGDLASLGGEPAWIEMNFGDNQQVRGFEVAFEKPGTPAFAYTYNLFYKSAQSTDWVKYQENQTASRTQGNNVKQHKFPYMQGVSAVRFELTGCEPGTAWPALAELKVFGEFVEGAKDTDSIAWKKPVHGNFNAASAYLVTDGNQSSGWTADMYPAYADIDLGENFDLSEIQVFTPTDGYQQYTVYTSLDNRDFDLVGEKKSTDICAEGGDKFALESKAARYVRVYMEYNSASEKSVLSEVRVLGTPNETPLQPTPAIAVEDFADSDYNTEVNDADAIEEVNNIIRRNVGAAYVDWFTFALAEQENGYDYFKLNDQDGKILVTGNNGVSLATGVNHYLKYFCNVHISQVGSQVKMPDAVVPVTSPVHKETKLPVRYAYNYCTHSYSMPFWGEEEWQIERDWLALNGVNLVLDITGQEEVWRRFLGKIGYTHQEAKDFIAGPSYYAWAYMANLTGFGGPVHDSWFEKRTELARENQLATRKLGMDVSLQAYSGMVPVDLATKSPAVSGDIITQGTWCSFRRPDMLRTDSATYADFAAKFYQAQEEVFGKTARYYATDPFHEGGNTGGMSTTTVASELLDSLLTYDENAVWVIQSWQGNPSSGLLAGLRTPTDRREHAIVLDLYAEKTENWKTYGEDTDGDGQKEFSDTPWVFCQLNNFGGRMGLHGHLDNVAERVPAAVNSAKHMTGIGIAPEASQNNPLLYDFLFETIWTDDASQPLPKIDVDQWLTDYARRRYGAQSDNAAQAMEILASTVYKSSLNMNGQGAPESVVNARPALSIGAASTWGNAIIAYNKTELEKAARLLLADYDKLKGSDAYLYDLADILKQVLSNTAQEVQKEMADAYREGDMALFGEKAERFLRLIDMVEQVLGTRREFLFGTWTTNASEIAEGTDQFTERLYLLNAKALVTTWGSISQCNTGGLKDYSNRQWAGLTSDFYKARWEKWIDAMKNGTSISSNEWFQYEWEYARDQAAYSNLPNGLSLKTLGEEVMENYTSPVEPPEPGPEKDIDPATTTASVGSAQSSEGAELAVDGKEDTLWHTAWSGTAKQNQWITIDLGSVKKVDGVRYLPRQGGQNGIVTQYQVEVSADNAAWAKVSEGKWAANARWKLASFDAVDARYVRLSGVKTVGDAADKYMTAAEVHVTAPAKADENAPAAFGPVPSNGQMQYYKQELSAFIHFGVNTFTNSEWGTGSEDPMVFDPTSMDAEQWVKTFKDAGFKRLIFTVKHHDGFVLYPSALTEHDVENSAYGEDVLAQVSAACTKYDMDMGLYLSPWDAHEPSYGSADGDADNYNDYYMGQLEEILGNSIYGNNGKFAEIWMDGAKGAGAAAQTYRFQDWFDLIKEQEGEDCVIFSPYGTEVRWIGNESGYGGEPLWQKVNKKRITDRYDAGLGDDNTYLNTGDPAGDTWSVAEADVSIRSGWFWHAGQQPKSLEKLSDIYFNSVGRGTPLLLNVPPSTVGRLDDADVNRLGEFGDAVKNTFATDLSNIGTTTVEASSTRGNAAAYRAENVLDDNYDSYWTTDDGTNTGTLTLTFDAAKRFDIVEIQEYIPLGQRIESFEVSYQKDGEWRDFGSGQTIGYKRLLRHTPVSADAIRIAITGSKAVPVINHVGAYKADRSIELKSQISEALTYVPVPATSGWTSESYANGHTNYWTNGTTPLEFQIKGSKFYVSSTVDPGHSTMDVYIDGEKKDTINLQASSREMSTIVYVSPDLAYGDHTVKLVKSGDKAVACDGLYVLNNDSKGMFELGASTYTVNEGENVSVTVNRVGGASGEATVEFQTTPGSAVHGRHYTDKTEKLTFRDGETVKTVTVNTVDNEEAAGNVSFYAEITDAVGADMGIKTSAEITIVDNDRTDSDAITSSNPLVLSTTNPVSAMAKNMVLSGEATVESNDAVGWVGTNGDKVGALTLWLNVPEVGAYEVNIHHFNGRENTLKWRNEATGVEDSTTVSYTNQNVNGAFNDTSVQMQFTQSGKQAITFYNDEDGAPNLHSFTFHAVEKTTDKTALNAAILAATALNESVYTADSWAVMTAALGSAKTVAADASATQSAVDNAALALTNAIAALIEKPVTPTVDKTALNAAILAATALNESAYTADSWAVLAAALGSAKTVAADAEATQSTVDHAALALTNAIAALIEKPVSPTVDKTALNAAILAATALTESAYTADSWAVLATALGSAKTVSADAAAAQSTVDNAALALTNAIAALIEKPVSPTAQHTITFMTNGGNSMTPVKVEAGKALAKPADPTRSGYEFRSWFTDAALTQEYDFTALVTADLTLYASWYRQSSGGGSTGGGATTPPVTPPIDIPDPDVPLTPAKPHETYTDTTTHWAAGAVDFVVENKLFNGTSDTSFSPDASMTRAMLATVLWRMAEKPAAAAASSFTDVVTGSYYADAVAWAAEKGIVTGISASLFAPDGQTTREQLAVMLYRYAGSPATSGMALSEFTDGASVSKFAEQAMLWAVQNGIITGKTSSALAPQGFATRAEVATMIQRFAQISHA